MFLGEECLVDSANRISAEERERRMVRALAPVPATRRRTAPGDDMPPVPPGWRRLR